MSIKNIIQQENDLQEMSPRSLANYLNNPTGQYNPYLVAGELQRKEAFAQRQMTEAPQETVVDELVAQAMPMGGMPRGRMPMPMPQPRPEEVMVSDTITETGIANLPAPNIGQNYAGGGIVEYDNGGEVGFFDNALDALDSPVVQGIEAAYFPKLTAASMALLPREAQAATLYDDEDFADIIEAEKNLAQEIALGGAGAAGTIAAKQKLADKKTAAAKKTEAKRTGTKRTGTKRKPTKVGAALFGLKELIKKGKDKLKPKPEKPLTKKQKADAKAKKIKDDKAKAKAAKEAPKKGPLTQATIDAAKYVGPKIGPGIRKVGRGIRDYPAEIAGVGGLGLGINALLNEGVLYGDTPEEAAAKAAQKLYNSPEEVEKRRVAAKVLANQAKEQARADALQAKRQEEADRRAYLALALGGAKTMAGQSPYALANIGEGLGTGVASLVELEEAEAARQSATDIAEQKFMNDLYKQSIDQMNKFAELKLKLRGGDDGGRMLEVLRAKLEDEGIEITDLSNPRYIELENETIIEMYPSMAPRGNAIVNGQAFTGV